MMNDELSREEFNELDPEERNRWLLENVDMVEHPGVRARGRRLLELVVGLFDKYEDYEGLLENITPEELGELMKRLDLLNALEDELEDEREM